MEREVGGGIGMGNTCKPLAVSFLCMTKSTTNKKKKKLKKKNKGDQSWVFIGRTDAEAETPVLWPPHAKS